jgi:hypothetical protein
MITRTPSLARNGHTLQVPAAEPAFALKTDAVPAVLQGSLASLGLQPVLRFLINVGKGGCLQLSRDGWAGRLSLSSGRLVGASFGQERGLAALDAILLVLSEGQFVFAEDPCPAYGGEEFAIDVDELSSRPPVVLARERGFAPAIGSPASIPRVAQLGGGVRDHSELKLRLGTLRTLLAVNGERTVRELVEDGGGARVLLDLAILTDLGLVNFETQPGRSAQLVG